jgi:putative ABC transport system permease protein
MVMVAVALAIFSTLAAGLYPTWRACSLSPATTLRIQ